MKVIIDIDNNIYTRLFDNGMPIDLTTTINDAEAIATAIRNGTPLPEHGRLIDADALTEKAPEIQEYLDVLAPTIIEGSDGE